MALRFGFSTALAAFLLAFLSPAALAGEGVATLEDDPPNVSAVTRNVGPRRGGEVVTITGTGLVDAKVTIGGKRACVVSASGTQIVLVTPPGKRGQSDIVVTSPDGKRAVSSYTYL
ncbi:MAG: IPT/TIG domain-containing protein [Planctomycetota bacterium]